MQHTGFTDVIIVGAGPSGLALAVALSHFKIKSVLLEKQHDICEDPRAIALAGDALRILSVLGVSDEEMGRISQPLTELHFHNGLFNSKPFLTMDHNHDWSEQASPNSALILQPGLEKILRGIAESSPYISLNLDCEVMEIDQSPDVIEAIYTKKGETEKFQVQGQYLVGADGKRGFVRKQYLEERGIVQETGLYEYEATWVAANLRVAMPTPKSHPEFPLWDLGYKPEELWELFWPSGFHFCAHPTMPVATGRFGPANERLWRFEYELPPNFELPDDVNAHLEEQMRDHLTLPPCKLRRGGQQPQTSVRFPWDCVHIRRCAPAHFAQKVVNRWYDGRAILIGDAAHVFPPFGAQGIVNGLRDAFGLSWRLALLCDPKAAQGTRYNRKSLLDAWSRERRLGVDESTKRTAENGSLLGTKSNLLPLALWCVGGVMDALPYLRDTFLRERFSDAKGFQGAENGFFLDKAGGGARNAQVHTKNPYGSFDLSDKLFWHSGASLTLLIVNPPTEEEFVKVSELLDRMDLPTRFLTRNIVSLQMDTSKGSVSVQQTTSTLSLLCPASADELRAAGHTPLQPYDPSTIKRRANGSKYVLLRPDFIVFSQAKTLGQLENQLVQAWDKVTE